MILEVAMLKPEETTAYDAFLQSGKIEDYMRYVGVKRQTQATAAQSAAVKKQIKFVKNKT